MNRCSKTHTTLCACFYFRLLFAKFNDSLFGLDAGDPDLLDIPADALEDIPGEWPNIQI
jgi:hypothetical protein